MELSRLHNKDALVEIITQNLNSHLENLPDDLERKGNGASIYRIPDHIKKVHPKAFKPKRVSFGPYHHGELHLSPMEKMKHLALRYFERRCGLCVEDIVNELWDMLEDLQRSYDKLDDEWKKKPTKFLEVMILDGCLMMQVLLEDTDVSKFTTTDVLRDMNLPTDVKKTLLERDYSHLLDMYRAELVFYKGNEWKPLQRSHLGMGHEIQLATRFHKAGIKFKKGCNLMDVYFDRKRGVLSLPFIEMNAHIESGLLNAMAFEKLYGIDNIVDSFVILMDNLMEKDEVDSFNQLAKGEVLGMWGHYTYVYNSVNEHCKRPWRIWGTTLKDVNFQSPWTIISTLSALIGFAFLIIQTVYGVYGYYLPHRS
ncbi:UPF0481 protein, partial [Cucurbita argyrosperma subsp. argyrosperma]